MTRSIWTLAFFVSLPSLASPCTGFYVNKDGMSLRFKKGGKVSMEYQGSKATCKSKGNPKYPTIDCGKGLESTGAFSDDCAEIKFNGVVWKKKKS